LLLAAGTSWKDWRPFKAQWYETAIAADFRDRAGALLDAEFPEATPIVLKDPRICRIAPFWFSVLEQKNIRPYVLIPFRSPLEVALSLRKLYGSSLNTGLLMWLRHNLDAEFFSRSYPRAFIHWPDLNENWKGTIAIAAERLGQPWPHFSNSAIADVDAFLSNRLWHNRIPISELDNHLEMHEWLLGVYEAYRELARDPASTSALAALDEIQSQFGQATRLFSRTLARLEISNSAIAEALANRQAQHRVLTAQHETLRARADQLSIEFAAKQMKVEALTASRVELANRADEGQRAVAELQAKLETTLVEIELLNTRANKFSNDLAAKQTEIETLAADLTSTTASRNEWAAQANEYQRTAAEWKSKHAEVLAALNAPLIRIAGKRLRSKFLRKD
jgi:hypothetical protein